MLEFLNATYKRAGVDVPMSDTGVSMPWHSLRHTFGTEMAGRGAPLPVLQALMGYESIETTMRYVSINRTQMDAAIDTLGSDGRGSHVAANRETTT